MLPEHQGRVRTSSRDEVIGDTNNNPTTHVLTNITSGTNDSKSSSDYTHDDTRDLEAARHTASDKGGSAGDFLKPLTPTGLTSQDGLEMLAREPSHHSALSHDDHNHEGNSDNQIRSAAMSRIQSRASTAHASGATHSATLAQVTSIIEIPDAFYNTHTRRRKIVLVCFCSFCAFLSPISSTSNLSATPEIAHEFATTGSVINVSNALYLLFMGLSPMFVGPLSQVFGRRMVSLPFLFILTTDTLLRVY